MQEEQATIQAIIDGDKEQYRLLVDRYQDGLVRYCYAMCLDEAMAKDIAQHAFIDAYKYLKKYNSKYAFSTWLYRIARNLALKEIKRGHKQQPLNDKEMDDREHVQDNIDREIEARRVHNVLKKLRHEWREVVHFYYWENLSYAEIAETMNKPLNTVKVWMKRAKKQLEQELSEEELS